ncbi:melanization protease 1-like [Zophobas morio]|uniref:melanization protease 1-like n=1 Tax=Zophobas morio TaxID=2755281 RepID=UPI003083DA71
MIVQWFILVVLIQQAHNACVKNRIELWDPTKCEAGRTFFAKLSSVSDNNYIAQPYLYPWLTELKVTLPDQTKSCTGALINDRYVLVAQDCIFPYIQPDQVTVHVGFFNGYGKDVSEIFQARTLQRKAAHFILHPNFDPGNLQTVANNLALIKLDEPVSYSKTIYPIQLPTIAEQCKSRVKLAKIHWWF